MALQPTLPQALAAEALGTFLLVLIGGGAGVALVLNGAAPGVGLLVAALAHGLALCIIINTLGRASGGHVNPAVTLSLASVGRFPWTRVPGYIIAQFVGAFVAALAIVGVYGMNAVHLAAASAPALPKGINGPQGLLAEALGTFILVLAVVAMAADTRITLPEGWAGFIIGLALLCGIFIAGAASGAGLNPALAISPYFVDGLFGGAAVTPQDIPVYLFGPIIGGVFAAFAYSFITSMSRGPVSPTGEVTARLPGQRTGSHSAQSENKASGA